MPNRIAAAAGAALTVAVLAACSSRRPIRALQRGLCDRRRTRREDSGRQMRPAAVGPDDRHRRRFFRGQAVINESAHPLIATSVRIQNLGAFHRRVLARRRRHRRRNLNGDTFTIVGTANGLKTDKPGEPATADFKIIVTC